MPGFLFMEKIYLSRRNLLILLSKLDRKREGQETACSIVKHENSNDVFKQTIDRVMITAVEDNEYYTTREPGAMHPSDEQRI